MIGFALTRFVQAVLAILAASLMLFVLARTTGNPADMLLPIEATSAEREAFIERQGLDRPIMYQYWVFLKDAARGDFGESLRTRRPVKELVARRLFNSFRLASAAMLFTVLIGVPLGILGAIYRGRVWDRLALAFALLGQSLPPFWIGLMGIRVFAVRLDWFPTSGIGGWDHYVMPAITLGWFASAGVVRLLRSSMLEVLDTEFVKLARLKGLPEYRVVLKHAVRNALIPVVTFIAFMYGAIIAAAITIEVVFAWPGLGQLAFQAVLWRDFPLLQFTVLTWVALIILINLIVDVGYVILDPRIRL